MTKFDFFRMPTYAQAQTSQTTIGGFGVAIGGNVVAEKLVHVHLTHRAFGPILSLSGCVFARPTTAERIRQMMRQYRQASSRPHVHAIHPADSERSGAVETNLEAEQCANGRSVRGSGREAVAQVHGGRSAEGIESAHFVLCRREAGAGSGNGGARTQSDASHRCDDRAGTGTTVTPPLTVGATVRSKHAGRAGTITCVHSDGPGSVRWHDKPSIAPDLGHERVSRSLLVLADEPSNTIAARRICIRAIRDAAMAPSDRAALDIAGDALRQIADLSETEARHA